MATTSAMFASIAVLFGIVTVAFAILCNFASFAWWSGDKNGASYEYAPWYVSDDEFPHKGMDLSWHNEWGDKIRALRALPIIVAAFAAFAAFVIILGLAMKKRKMFFAGSAMAFIALLAAVGGIVVGAITDMPGYMSMSGLGFFMLVIALVCALFTCICAVLAGVNTSDEAAPVEEEKPVAPLIEEEPVKEPETVQEPPAPPAPVVIEEVKAEVVEETNVVEEAVVEEEPPEPVVVPVEPVVVPEPVLKEDSDVPLIVTLPKLGSVEVIPSDNVEEGRSTMC